MRLGRQRCEARRPASSGAASDNGRRSGEWRRAAAKARRRRGSGQLRGKEIGKGGRSNGEAALGSKQRRQRHDCSGAGRAATHVALQGRKKERESEADQWTPPDLNKIRNISKDFKSIQNLIQPKTDIPKLQKFKIKYGCQDFGERNNFIHRNFFRFQMYFELKIWEVKVCFGL
jgi:hypothetical protein